MNSITLQTGTPSYYIEFVMAFQHPLGLFQLHQIRNMYRIRQVHHFVYLRGCRDPHRKRWCCSHRSTGWNQTQMYQRRRWGRDCPRDPWCRCPRRIWTPRSVVIEQSNDMGKSYQIGRQHGMKNKAAIMLLYNVNGMANLIVALFFILYCRPKPSSVAQSLKMCDQITFGLSHQMFVFWY